MPPLVAFDTILTPPKLHAAPYSPGIDDDDGQPHQKRWHHYIPLSFAIILMLAPHPPIVLVLVNYYYRIHHQPWHALGHLLAIYTITFLAFSSLIVILARDPGPVTSDKAQSEAVAEDEEQDFMQALMGPPEEEDSPQRWCRRCNAPKPERAHHCGACGRCVLRMDHHCMWLGHKCIGHRTQAAFVHFLFSVTALATYVAIVCTRVVYWAFIHAVEIDESTPVYAMFLAFYGIVMTMVVGSFCAYHIYLVSTNQTTLESLSPFLLLRDIPPLPPQSPSDPRRLSNPPLEHELSFEQRCVVRDAHRHIRLYDLGFRKNWAHVFGWSRPWGWVHRLLVGGGCKGDGRTFTRNPQADEMLSRLASALVSADKDR